MRWPCSKTEAVRQAQMFKVFHISVLPKAAYTNLIADRGCCKTSGSPGFAG
jgi:hypothetical protein